MATAARGGLTLLVGFVLAFWLVSRSPQPRLAAGGCGPRSLQAVSDQLGIHHAHGAVSSMFQGGGQETSLAEIQSAARRLGLYAEGRQMTVNDLRRARPLGILHIDNTHFVALLGCGADAVQIADPAYEGEPRRETWSYDDLAAHWDGMILVISKRNPIGVRAAGREHDNRAAQP